MREVKNVRKLTVPISTEKSSRTNASALRRPTPLGDEVYNAIYSQLMSHKIAPGGRISVDSLARELGVSQTPVREALSRLEAQGLVVKTHLIGYSAAEQMDEQKFEQLYELRMLLEPFAAARAAVHMSEDSMNALESLANSMKLLERNNSKAAYGQFAQSDSQFHNLIALGSGNELVHSVLSNIHTHVHLFRLFYHSRATADANNEHDQIIDALRRRDPDAAATSMRRHIECSKARFTSCFSD
ncbi:GntR family transcriptional regulator [Microvirga aerilata]|uniref:GntR family transcriptional regulator n=1 Tax=Microvirga aerilata TaxID=670292 RepID=UPI001FE8B445|nr:GntR family transcriptional regulator [Microvirga aerilata]